MAALHPGELHSTHNDLSHLSTATGLSESAGTSTSDLDPQDHAAQMPCHSRSSAGTQSSLRVSLIHGPKPQLSEHHLSNSMRMPESSLENPATERTHRPGRLQSTPEPHARSQTRRTITFTMSIPDDSAMKPTQSDASLSIQEEPTRAANVTPEDLRRLLGIPAYSPRRQPPVSTGPNIHKYEKKYPPDEPGQETSQDARFFKVYLDEAEAYDQEIIRSHRDSLDSLLVFAALFSAVVTTFVVQTSQSLQPDQGLITNYLLLEQIQILRNIGNATAVSGISPSHFLPDSSTHLSSDIWVNALFFASLSLSLSTALLSVLAKQWLQAYDSSTLGSARDRALVRHLRFMGLNKWKLNEIIGALPLVLHASVGVFLVGLIVFLWALYTVLAYIVVVISGLSFAFYLGSVILPAIDLRCPYRIPLLYRPMRYLVVFFSVVKEQLRVWMATVTYWLKRGVARLIVLFNISSLISKCRFGEVSVGPNMLIYAVSHLISCHLVPLLTHITPTPPSLRDAELSVVQSYYGSIPLITHSISWLHDISSNQSVQRIAVQGLSGHHQDWRGKDVPDYVKVLCTPRLFDTATEGLFDREDVALTWEDKSIGVWVRAVRNLHFAWSNLAGETKDLDPVPREKLVHDIYLAAMLGRVNHVSFLCDYVNVNEVHPLVMQRPLYIAARRGRLEVVRVLLERGADVNASVDEEGYGSALQAASAYGHLDVVRLLLERGAEVNLRGGEYGCALKAAEDMGHMEVAKLLVEHGAISE